MLKENIIVSKEEKAKTQYKTELLGKVNKWLDEFDKKLDHK